MPHRAVVKLHKGRDKRLKAGHLWVYSGEINTIHGNPEPGGLVDVINHAGHFLGRGYYNPASQISVRLLTRADEPIDRQFFDRRISEALGYRAKFYSDQEAFRIIYGEGDFLPGLVVDKFGDILVVQFLSLGMDTRRDVIVDALSAALCPAGIYERSDVSVRRLEGLPERKGPISGDFETKFSMKENGISFVVDVAEGQKTGYFLDQKDNRRALAPLISPGDKVVDAFCHTGTFGIHAARYGAGSVNFIDISDLALETAKENASANGLEDRCSFILGNAFDVLRQMERDREEYDVVVLDPPAFTKNRDTVDSAVRGYKEINIRGCKLAKPGGFLVTCSCSHHISKELFMDVVADAGRDAGKTLRLVEYRTQAKDHPIIVGLPETEYLKCAIFQVF